MDKEVFLKRINTTIAWFGEYINCDKDVDDVSKYYNPLYYRYARDLRNLCSNPLSLGRNGEVDFHYYFNYFNDNIKGNNIDYSRIDDKDNSISFNSQSLNLFGERLSLRQNYEKLKQQFQDSKFSKSDEKMLDIKDDYTSFLMRQLFSFYGLKQCGDASRRNQFTFGGERFITNGEIQHDGTIKAIPYRESENNKISGIRLLEKIIMEIEEKKDNTERVIKIATFGKLINAKNEIEVLEKIVEKTVGEHWKIEITSFSLKELTSFATIVESEDKKIKGNLLDKEFYIKNCKHFDIIFFLDTGYLKYDTHKFSDAYGFSPARALSARLNSFVNFVDSDYPKYPDYRFLNGLYLSLVKYIESTFYHMNHSFEFDPRLYFTLCELKKELGSQSLYMFCSCESLHKSKYFIKCGNEFFDFSSAYIYDWSNYEQLTKEELNKRNEDIIKDPYSDINIIPLNLWTLIKSMGKYFYSKGFINLFKNEQIDDEQLKDESLDEDFIAYAYKTSIYIDYSHFDNGHISFGISNNGDNQSEYNKIANLLVKNLMYCVLDTRCFDVYSIPFCKNALATAMHEGAIGIKHLVATKKMSNIDFSRHMDITTLDQDVVDKLDKITNNIRPQSHKLYNQHQRDNMILQDFLDENDTLFSKYKYYRQNPTPQELHEYFGEEKVHKYLQSVCREERETNDLSTNVAKTLKRCFNSDDITKR